MYQDLKKIADASEKPEADEVMNSLYPALEKISFDDAILEKLDPSQMFVISSDLGWSDVGTWDALKEALTSLQDDNITQGKVMLDGSIDTLLFNYTGQLAVGIDLKEIVIINTHDVLLICPKDSIPKIKKFVEKLDGTPHEDLA
jgi:mannose-1-phosphate guanylyltransferase